MGKNEKDKSSSEKKGTNISEQRISELLNAENAADKSKGFSKSADADANTEKPNLSTSGTRMKSDNNIED